MPAPPRAEASATLDPLPSADPGQWLDAWAARQGDALAWADDHRTTSYREAADRVARLAAWLRDRGVGRGDRVALWLANRGAVLEAVFACARIGAVVLPLNARLTPSEIAFQLGDAEPRVLLVERSVRARADQAIAGAPETTPIVLEVGDGPDARRSDGGDPYEQALASNAPLASDSALDSSLDSALDSTRAAAELDPEDPMILMYTSGTTGLPKGALLPRRKTLFNCRNARACFGIDRTDRVLVPVPLFHSLGLQILALPAIACGAGVVIQEGFDPVRVWRAVLERGITYLGGVPTAHQRLLEVIESDPSPPPRSLRFLFTAGAAAPAELIRAYHRRGIAMIQGYGQTETSLLTCLAAEHALAKAGSVGRPLPHAEIRLIEPASVELEIERWRDVAPGVVGELVVRGPITMTGYWRRPEATRETLRGEWIRTGDLATRDVDFDITLVGRAREMYISGGENVYPAEVEAVLLAHPDIAEAAVVAVADERWGEVGRAHLVARPGTTLDLAALGDWLGTRLARFKQPRAFVLETALPRTASGKVQKHRLGEPAR